MTMADAGTPRDAFPLDPARLARHLRLRLEAEGRAGLAAVGRIPAVRAGRGSRRSAPSAPAGVTAEQPGPQGAAQPEAMAAEMKAGLAEAARARPDRAADEDTRDLPVAARERQPTVHVKGPGLFDQQSPDLDDGASPEDALQRIADEVAQCTLCAELAANRTNTVPGQGSAYADLMFIGEGPGADEDAQGIDFIGRAGQLLTKMIEAIGVTRDEVFIANIVKCRPPGNRNPAPEEEANCAPYLARQIEVIRPKVVVALGGVAAKYLLQTHDGITRLRGRFYPYMGAQLMPTFHPAYVLRNYTKDTRQAVYDDLLAAKAALVE